MLKHQEAASTMTSTCKNGPHILLIPFPASGHIIPLLDLVNQLLNQGLTLTILVTPSNLNLLEPLLSTHPSNSLQTLVLPYPNVPNNPNPIYKLEASNRLSKPITEWFQEHPSPPIAIISDFLFGWTNPLASKLGVPRLVFWTSPALASLITESVWKKVPDSLKKAPNEPILDQNLEIPFPDIPHSPVFTKHQLKEETGEYEEGDPVWESFRDSLLENFKSWGAVYNSFREIEGVYLDHVKKEMGHERVWAVGPLLIESSKRGGSSVVEIDEVATWLDAKCENSVVYVCFGSRMELSNEEVEALAGGLEKSGVDFIWCVKAQNKQHVDAVITKEYEDRVAGRGLIIRGWAPQVAILGHKATSAFLTHCGWNSILEGIAGGVVMLTWPMGADQFISEKLVVDELGVGKRVCEGGTMTIPEVNKLAEMFVQSVGTNSASWLNRDRVVELRDCASKAVECGGSSRKEMDSFVKELREINSESLI